MTPRVREGQLTAWPAAGLRRRPGGSVPPPAGRPPAQPGPGLPQTAGCPGDPTYDIPVVAHQGRLQAVSYLVGAVTAPYGRIRLHLLINQPKFVNY